MFCGQGRESLTLPGSCELSPEEFRNKDNANFSHLLRVAATMAGVTAGARLDQAWRI
jgi:hypothetical protein